MAMCLDGHVAHPTEAWNFGTNEDRRRMDKLREWADCLIVSRKTLEHDNMNLSVRTKPHAEKHPRPVIIMETARPMKLELTARNLRAEIGGELWIAKTAGAVELKELWPDANRDWQIYRHDKVVDIVESLALRGYKKLLLEGGPTLNGLFFEASLVDEFHLTLLPLLWGGTTTDRSVITRETLPLTRFHLRRAEKRGDEMFFRYVKSRSN